MDVGVDKVDNSAEKLLKAAIQQLPLSALAFHRALKFGGAL